MFAFRKIFIVMLATGFLLSACSGQKATEVKITLTEFGTVSSITDFQVGVPYHFVVTNAGTVNHEITIMPPMTEEELSMGMDMAELDKIALAMISADELTPGATKSFEYTFSEPAPAGSLEFACHTPGHYEAGMKLPITVK